MSAKTVAIRTMADVPSGEPRRYLNHRGYVRLRWLIGPQTYAEAYEHRLVMGLPPRHMHVHHINGDKLDNRRENLVVLTASEHQKLHAADPDWMRRALSRRARRQPLSSYPRCGRDGCTNAAQCLDRTICLKHYKEIQRRERGVVPRGRRVA